MTEIDLALMKFCFLCFCLVTEIDLALMRDAEAVARDKKQFMNDGEWELLSVDPHYRQVQYGDQDFAHIHFHVGHRLIKLD